MMQWRGGRIIPLPVPGIAFDCPYLIRCDRLYFTPAVCDFYLSNLTAGIKAVFLAEVVKKDSS